MSGSGFKERHLAEPPVQGRPGDAEAGSRTLFGSGRLGGSGAERSTSSAGRTEDRQAEGELPGQLVDGPSGPLAGGPRPHLTRDGRADGAGLSLERALAALRRAEPEALVAAPGSKHLSMEDFVEGGRREGGTPRRRERNGSRAWGATVALQADAVVPRRHASG